MADEEEDPGGAIALEFLKNRIAEQAALQIPAPRARSEGSQQSTPKSETHSDLHMPAEQLNNWNIIQNNATWVEENGPEAAYEQNNDYARDHNHMVTAFGLMLVDEGEKLNKVLARFIPLVLPDMESDPDATLASDSFAEQVKARYRNTARAERRSQAQKPPAAVDQNKEQGQMALNMAEEPRSSASTDEEERGELQQDSSSSSASSSVASPEPKVTLVTLVAQQISHATALVKTLKLIARVPRTPHAICAYLEALDRSSVHTLGPFSGSCAYSRVPGRLFEWDCNYAADLQPHVVAMLELKHWKTFHTHTPPDIAYLAHNLFTKAPGTV